MWKVTALAQQPTPLADTPHQPGIRGSSINKAASRGTKLLDRHVNRKEAVDVEYRGMYVMKPRTIVVVRAKNRMESEAVLEKTHVAARKNGTDVLLVLVRNHVADIIMLGTVNNRVALTKRGKHISTTSDGTTLLFVV